MRALAFTLTALALVGCKEPIEAPSELNDLSHYLWAEWDNEDPEVLMAGVVSLEAWAAGQPADTESWPDRFYSIDPIPAATVDAEGLVSHGRSSDEAPGVGELYVSLHAPPVHATLFGEADQTDPIEPASPEFYERTITSGDPAAFAAGTEEVLESSNDCNRKNILFDLNYQFNKVWRWITLEDGREVIVSRSWAPEVGQENDGKQIFQAYSMELYIPNDAGGALRWLVTWQEAELGLDQDAIESLVGGSMNDTFESQDELLSGE
ncbi:MAG: hypothetical protein H6741_05365 [Alphaproteobacteria bacterium]|nr:hypothetical protein [Alphaproteobacteria bacterium]MCB9792135.1 hypothetical protein [Alphaproteobacteria bacterium]